MRDRGVSSPLGVILLLGITITAVTSLFFVGAAALADTRTDAEQSQTENAMAQFSSKASLVGLGESGDQRFSLGRISEGDVTVDPDAGRVTLFINRTGESEREELNSTSLGAIVYRSGDREIAYQGGGVWERRDGHSQMISPPEYHYQLETLTFPIVTVSGAGRSSGDVRGSVRRETDPQSWYPMSGVENRSNPLEEGSVTVQVESRYCRGWVSFFTHRSQGKVKESCGDDETLEVDLTVPFSISGDEPVIAKSINPSGGGGDIPEGWTEGTVAPSISPEVESELESCASGGCDDPSGTELTAGTYNASGTPEFDGITFNTSDGDITVVTGGDLELNDIEITGGGNVTMYVRGELAVDSAVNDGGNATQLVSLVHSDGGVRFDGNSDYTGVIYAPKSDLTFNGAPAISYRGALVAEDLNINGNIKKFDFEADPNLSEFRIVTGSRALTYLHVSENGIEVDLD